MLCEAVNIQHEITGNYVKTYLHSGHSISIDACKKTAKIIKKLVTTNCCKTWQGWEFLRNQHLYKCSACNGHEYSPYRDRLPEAMLVYDTYNWRKERMGSTGPVREPLQHLTSRSYKLKLAADKPITNGQDANKLKEEVVQTVLNTALIKDILKSRKPEPTWTFTFVEKCTIRWNRTRKKKGKRSKEEKSDKRDGNKNEFTETQKEEAKAKAEELSAKTNELDPSVRKLSSAVKKRQKKVVLVREAGYSWWRFYNAPQQKVCIVSPWQIMPS